MGSIFRLPALQTEVDPLLELLRKREYRCLATLPLAEHSYLEEDLTPATALFLGGEGAGLPAKILDRIDRSLSIPLRPGVESLSVAAAAAVLLFEAARQRGRRD